MNGMVYLVGAGPGDYRLITLKGKECLEKADVVICDYLVKKISVNLSLIKQKKENAWYA